MAFARTDAMRCVRRRWADRSKTPPLGARRVAAHHHGRDQDDERWPPYGPWSDGERHRSENGAEERPVCHNLEWYFTTELLLLKGPLSGPHSPITCI